MKVDLLILQLAVLLLPGLIWARLDARFVLNGKPTDTEFLIRAFMFGLASYAATYLLYSAMGWPFVLVDFSDADKKAVLSAPIAKEIASALLVGVALSILWIYAGSYKWLTRILQKIKATKTYGDEDVWDYTFNSNVANVEYVHFRDIENQLVYCGWVDTFSESEKLRELVLSNVDVFDFDGNLLYNTPLLYLARPADSIHIEFPYRPTRVTAGGEAHE